VVAPDYWMDAPRLAKIRRMGRYTFPDFHVPTPRYAMVWDLQWALIECQRLEPAANISAGHSASRQLVAKVLICADR
jgi:hypothetical protein